jgi:SMC interacting uncharacterized protein involved in chromosome segregation
MPRKIPNGKKQLLVLIDSKIVKELWEIIKMKYPESTYGALSLEVQDALANWIAQHKAQIHTKSMNPKTPKNHEIAKEIIDYLRSCGFELQVNLKVLRQTIAKLRGNDERTIKKWIKFLEENGFIKKLNQQVYEIL